jgi:hypothetical protein
MFAIISLVSKQQSAAKIGVLFILLLNHDIWYDILTVIECSFYRRELLESQVFRKEKHIENYLKKLSMLLLANEY